MRPVALVAHGAGAGSAHPFLRAVVDNLGLLGVDAHAFDFPYMAAGRRAPDRPPALRAALLAAAARVRRRDRPFVVVGKSMGGRVAAEALVAGALDADALVVLGYPLGDKPDRAATLRALATPALIIQGTRDTFGAPSALAATSTPAFIHSVDGADHAFAVRGRAFADVLDEITTVTATWLGLATAPQPRDRLRF